MNTGLVKQEPTLVLYVVTWLLTNAGAVLVGRTHLIAASQWSAVSSTAAPFVTAAVLAVVALLHRRLVAPAWKVAEQLAADAGLDLPPDLADEWLVKVGLVAAAPEPVPSPETPGAPAG